MPRKNARDGRVTVGVVGRITEGKGHHLLLEAIGRLPAHLRDGIQLLIVGAAAPGSASDLHYARFLRQEAARMGLQNQIVWTGYQTELARYYASMDVLVHPSLAEAMGIAIVEALDCGIPVIAARTGGIPEVVQDGVNGLLVSVKDCNALTETLTVFLTNDQIRGRLQAGAREGVDKRFSEEVFSSKIRATIGELCPPSVSGEAPCRAGLERW
jgi:glycosyltransferase involved in cell wall biosynthesis